MSETLEFDSIDLSFDGRRILSGVYVKCERGKITGLLGRNGSGKSTMLKVVFGSQSASYKSVRLNGVSLTGDYIKRRAIAYLPQDDLIPSFIIIEKAIRLFGVNVADIIEEVPEVEPLLKHHPEMLSGGYRRLVEALLILKSPATFCLLDEPFSGLSPIYIERLIAILQKVKLEKGILITDHLYKYVTDISDQLYLVTNGSTRLIHDKQDLVDYGYVNSL